MLPKYRDSPWVNRSPHKDSRIDRVPLSYGFQLRDRRERFVAQVGQRNEAQPSRVYRLLKMDFLSVLSRAQFPSDDRLSPVTAVFRCIYREPADETVGDVLPREVSQARDAGVADESHA